MIYDYKQLSGILRIPYKGQKSHKPMLSDSKITELLSGDFVIEEKLDGKGIVKVHDDHVLFIEHLHERHSVHYSKLPCFNIVFDIWDAHTMEWLKYEPKVKVAESFGYPAAPRLQETFGTMSLDMIIKHYMEGKIISEFGEEEIEGIVIKNYDKGIFGKLIRTEFTEQLTVYYRDRLKYMPTRYQFNWYA